MTRSHGLQKSRCYTNDSDTHPLQNHVQGTSSLPTNTPTLNAAESLVELHLKARTPTLRNASCSKLESVDSETNASLHMLTTNWPSFTLQQSQTIVTMKALLYGTCFLKKKILLSSTCSQSQTQTMTLITISISWIHLQLNGRGSFVQLPRLSGTVGKSYF